MLGVVLEQRVDPGGAVTGLFAGGVGLMEAVPPQMEEQPVALEMNIFSPNSWVIRRA